MEQDTVIVKDTNEPKNNKNKGGKIRYFINIALVLGLTIASLVITLWGDKFSKVSSMFSNCDYRFIFVVLGLVIASILIRGLIFFCFARLFKRKYYFHQALAVEEIGNFYNGVTPGSSGEQVMEAVTYKKQGLNISSAVSIIAMIGIIYPAVTFIYGLISFIMKYNFINEIGSITIQIAELRISLPIWVLTILGFAYNIFCIALVVLMSYWSGFHRFILGPVVNFLNKIKIVKNKEKTQEKLRISVENFKIELRRLLTNIPFLILITVLFFGLLTVKFCVPYFCGLALKNQSTNASFWDSVFLSNYHQMITSIIPIPGGAGISEYFFVKLFCGPTDGIMGFYAVLDVTGKAVFDASNSLTSAALLLWRTLTFTLPMLAGGLVSMFYKGSPKDVIDKSEHLPNRETFVSLQKETLQERFKDVETLVATTALNRAAVLEKLKNTKDKDPVNNNKDRYDEINIESDEKKNGKSNHED